MFDTSPQIEVSKGYLKFVLAFITDVCVLFIAECNSVFVSGRLAAFPAASKKVVRNTNLLSATLFATTQETKIYLG